MAGTPPTKTVKVGQVQVAKWVFPGKQFDSIAYTIQKSYKKKDSEKYETTNYLKAQDLADLQLAIHEVQQERVKVYDNTPVQTQQQTDDIPF